MDSHALHGSVEEDMMLMVEGTFRDLQMTFMGRACRLQALLACAVTGHTRSSEV